MGLCPNQGKGSGPAASSKQMNSAEEGPAAAQQQYKYLKLNENNVPLFVARDQVKKQELNTTNQVAGHQPLTQFGLAGSTPIVAPSNDNMIQNQLNQL